MPEVVRLGPAEWQAYKAIRLEALQVEPQAFGASYEKALETPDEVWSARLAHPGEPGNSWIWFARHEREIVGLIGGYPNKDLASVDLNSFYVRPAVRGQGLGRELLRALLSEISSKPHLKVVRLGVNREQAAAIALYKAFGFAETGSYTGKMGDGQIHEEITMERPLSG